MFATVARRSSTHVLQSRGYGSFVEAEEGREDTTAL